MPMSTFYCCPMLRSQILVALGITTQQDTPLSNEGLCWRWNLQPHSSKAGDLTLSHIPSPYSSCIHESYAKEHGLLSTRRTKLYL